MKIFFPFARRSGDAGVAILEFALILPVFVTFFFGVADFSLVYRDQLQLSAALAAGAQYAFTQAQTESGATLTADVTGFVRAVSLVTFTAVTTTNNNGLSATSCYCVNGATPSYTGPVTCGAACTDGSGATAGKYVAITASFAYTAMFPPDQTFFTAPRTQTVTVRVQ